MMKRSLDIIFALIAGVVFIIPCLLIALLIKTTSIGPTLYISKRVGRHGKLFYMPKFRTMHVETPELATDKLGDPTDYLTPIGSFLRTTSLDELPQIISVLLGHMSLVGPRPALFNQNDLIAHRQELGINNLRPGITGWAQVCQGYAYDIDSSSKKITYDLFYIKNLSFLLDMTIIMRTIRILLTGFGSR